MPMFHEGSGMEAQRAETEESYELHLRKLLMANEAVIMVADKKSDRILAKEVIDPRDFSDVLPADEIETDIEKTTEKQSRFRQPRKEGEELLEKLAFSTETLVYHQVGVGGWLSADGIRAYVEKTAAPDDLLRGTDLVIEFEGEDGTEPLAISVDLTIGTGMPLQEKIRRIKNGIDNGILAEVRYHTAPDGAHRPLSKAAKVAIGISPEKAAHLARLWTSEEKGDAARLSEHPIRVSLARQTYLQLTAYEEYARLRHQPDRAARLGTAKTLIGRVLRHAESTLGDDPTLAAEDSLFAMRLALRTELGSGSTHEDRYDPESPAHKYTPLRRFEGK
jgi:hypothetical protein